MLTSMIVTIVSIVFFIFFIFYKRKLLMRIFSINTIEPANQFKHQLEQTADEIIGRMENKIAELEYLLEVADEKISKIEEQIKISDAAAASSVSCSPEHGTLPGKSTPEYNISGFTLLEPTSNLDIDQEAEKLDNLTRTRANQDDDDKRKLVLAMAEQGYNITEISKATGKGKGEIMLLLQLHKR